MKSNFGRLGDRRAARIARLLKRSGRVGSGATIAHKSAKMTLVSALVSFPASALLGVTYSLWFLLLAMVPLLVVAAPELRLRDAVAQRREGVERDLPFFAVFVSVLGSAGVSLYSVLKDIAKSEVFPWVGREALLVRRDVEILGMNPNDSIERLAESHPSKKFSDFLLGYTSKVRSGGDVPFYLVGESGEQLRDLEEGWARYAARVGIVGSMMITVFGVIPLLLMVVGVFSPGFSTQGLIYFTGLGVPLFTMLLVRMAGRMQPMRDDSPRGRMAIAVGLGAAPGAAVGLTTGVAWEGAAAALFGFSFLYGLSVRGQLREKTQLDDGLSRFLKDLLEFKRQEYDLARAIIAIEKSGRYNRSFARTLSRVASQLRAGVPLDEVKVECRSRLGRLTFLLLGEMSRSGGGTVDTVYQISSFSSRLEEMKQNAGSEVKPYLVLSYVSPLLLAFGITFVSGILSSFGSRASPGISVLHISGVQLGSMPSGISQISDLLIVVSAAALGLIGAKIADLTVRNTLRASLNVILSVAAIVAMSALGSHSLSQIL